MKTEKKITQHSFIVEDATEYGVEEATILYNIRFWLQSNKANERNIHDGRVWTYNTTKALAELFPYFSESQISRRLKKLEDAGILVTGNYNKVKYDRTKWYSIAEEEYIVKNGDNEVENSISQNRKMEDTESLNGNSGTVEPIPDNKPDNKLNIKKQDIKQDNLDSQELKNIDINFRPIQNSLENILISYMKKKVNPENMESIKKSYEKLLYKRLDGNITSAPESKAAEELLKLVDKQINLMKRNL